MAFKRIERFNITNNVADLGLGGIKILNRDLGWLDDNLNDYMQVIGGQYGRSNKWIQTMYNINELFRIETSGRINRLEFFEDFRNKITSEISTDYNITNMAIGMGLGATLNEYGSLRNQVNFHKDAMEMEILSGFETYVDYDNDVATITIGKGALIYKGEIWLNDQDETYTHNISGTTTTRIHANVKNGTITNIIRQKKNNQPATVKSYKEINFISNNNFLRTFGQPNDPTWNTTQEETAEVFPLFFFETTENAGNIVVSMSFMGEILRTANIPYLIPYIDKIQEDYD